MVWICIILFQDYIALEYQRNVSKAISHEHYACFLCPFERQKGRFLRIFAYAYLTSGGSGFRE